MPVGKGLPFAVRNGKAIGCTAIQVFTNNPRQWKGKDVTDEMADDLQAALKECDMVGAIASHDTYLVNLCAPGDETRQKSIDCLTDELNRCGKLGIPYTVSHMGAHLKQGEEEGLRIVAENAKIVLENSADNSMLLMETTAGQGSSLNYKFEHLATLLDHLGGHKRVGVCVDTCHIFAAGYDIRDAEGYEKTFAEFDRLVGIDRIKLIHCNDSKKALGTRVDRHEHIGKGEIGIEAFRCLVNDDRFARVPILVETPEADKMHEVNVRQLWELIEK